MQLWRWLSDKENRATVAVLGGLVVAAVGGLWTAYVHFSDASNGPPAGPSVTANQGVAAGGDVNVGGDLTIGLTLADFTAELEKKEAQYRAQLAELESDDDEGRARIEAQLAAVEAQLSGRSEAFEAQTARLAELQQSLDALRSEAAPESVDRAKRALSAGDSAEAEAVLAEAVEQGGPQAAGAAFQLGTLAEARFDFEAAGGYFRQASELDSDNARYRKAAERLAAQVAAPARRAAGPALTALSDDFDGDALADHWEVLNANRDAFLVENGQLLAVNSTPGKFSDDSIENLFRLTRPMPEGDWVVTARLSIDFQTNQERIFLGLFQDKQNYMIGQLSTAAGQCVSGGSYRLHLYLSPAKMVNGKATSSRHQVWSIPYCDKYTFNAGMAQGQPMLLRLRKAGRSYFYAVKMEGAEKPEWKEVPALKLLKQRGDLAFGLYQAKSAKGETSITVDWIRIEAAADSG